MAENKKVDTMEEMEEAEVITLEFDDGEEVECEVMGVFDFNGKDYIALVPDDGTDDVYIYGYQEVGEEEFTLIDIDDDEEWEMVADVWQELTEKEEI